jgi:hypothetical protein
MVPRQRLVSPDFGLLARDVDVLLFVPRVAVFPPDVASDLRVAEVRLVAAAARGAAAADLRGEVALDSAAAFVRVVALGALGFAAEVLAAGAFDFAVAVFAAEVFAAAAVVAVALLAEALLVALAGEAAAVLRAVVTALLAWEATFPFAAPVFFSLSVCDFDRSFFVVLEAFAMLPS